MSGQPDLARSVAQWASKADHDFRNAEYTLTLQEDCPFEEISRAKAERAVMLARAVGTAARLLLAK